MQETQTLDARYIDGAALVALLKQLFGDGNFKINVQQPLFKVGSPWLTASSTIQHIDDVYTLKIPRTLTKVICLLPESALAQMSIANSYKEEQFGIQKTYSTT